MGASEDNKPNKPGRLQSMTSGWRLVLLMLLIILGLFVLFYATISLTMTKRVETSFVASPASPSQQPSSAPSTPQAVAKVDCTTTTSVVPADTELSATSYTLESIDFGQKKFVVTQTDSNMALAPIYYTSELRIVYADCKEASRSDLLKGTSIRFYTFTHNTSLYKDAVAAVQILK